MVKVFVATAQSQGHRTNDFHHCIDGELVMLAAQCGLDAGDPDGRCGCGRGFHGLNSHRSTTTALVKDLPGFTIEDYLEAFRSSLDALGFTSDRADEYARDLLSAAQQFPVGAVVERRLDTIIWRQPT